MDGIPDTSQYRIWDAHAHLLGVPGDSPEARLAELVRYADRMGVERLCVFMGTRLVRDPSPEELRRQNDEVLEALRHWRHRALGFVYLSARHIEASLAELERCVARGPMVGVKLWVAERCSVPELDPVIRRAVELKAVIFQHAWLKSDGNPPGESTPADVAALASRHPDARIICGHTGGEWESGIRAIRPYPNVSAGIGGFDPTAGVVEMAVQELGPERVVYGSDFGGRSLASQIAKVVGAAVSDEVRTKILGGNLRRLLEPILREKDL